jgi:hypothetical protein
MDGGPLLSPSFELMMLAGYGGMLLLGLFSRTPRVTKAASRTSSGEKQ